MSWFNFLFGKKSSSDVSRKPEILEGLLSTQIKLIQKKSTQIKVYTYEELKRASNNFSSANHIGSSNFGSVYKGVLKGGMLIALRALSVRTREGLKEFLTDVNTIFETKHENLVELYGYCVEENHRILVYRYLENKSLAQNLLGGGQCNIYFDWRTRCRICIGVARGLAFLHEQKRPNNTHRDLTCHNILLDKDLTPMISNFGLGRLIPGDFTDYIRCHGHIGPEYTMGEMTCKADVYSFGVILIEIVGGRTNTNLIRQTRELYKKKELFKLVDLSLNGFFDAEEAYKILKIAFLCIDCDCESRPTMSSVVKMLTGEIDVYKGYK